MATMLSLSCKVSALIVLLTAGLLSAASAQSVNPSEWEILRPDGEEFTVSIPKGSTFESGKQPYHKMELNTRMYISNTKGGPVLAVVSLSGIKSNPAAYTEVQRFNSYVDAFKNLFSAKVRGPGATAKLTLVGDKTLQGNVGREYRMTIGDLAGLAQVFITKKRFYAIAYLNTKKGEALQEQFLSSFVLPEKTAEPSAAVASQEVPAAPQSEQSAAQAAKKPSGGEAPGSEATVGATTDANPEASNAATQPGKGKPIQGGVLNGKAISFPKPEHPAQADAAGTVVVQVVVDEQGNVISAQAASGPASLHTPSVNAALQAKFSPTLLMGEPVKVAGVLIYRFVR
jgi:TonB-like protein